MARWYGAGPEGYAARYRAIADPGVLGELGALASPTVVLAGIHDPFNPPDRLETLAGQIPDCQFKTIEAGHFAAVQSPETLTSVLAGVLND